jgi:hypothetical protein
MIPETQEVEMGRIMVLSQSIQVKSWQDSISTNKLGMVVHTCYPKNAGSIGRRIIV